MTYELKEVEYRFKDTPDTYGRAFIVVGSVPEKLKEMPSFDDGIFYYCDTQDEFEQLKKKDNDLADFYIVEAS